MLTHGSIEEDLKRRLIRRLWASKSKHELQKDRNPERVTGTCEWFTTHQRFQLWREGRKSSLLWVSADPGCGKSVLAKYLVDEIVPSTSARTTCYFFFKDDFEDQKKLAGAICCILSQLFRQRPALLSDQVLLEFEEGGEDIFTSFHDLWSILIHATKTRNAGEIVCILDALDECEGKGQSELARALSKFYGNAQQESVLKFLVTSRPYAQIQQDFKQLKDYQPTIHLSGESQEEIEKISHEIDIVIQARLDGMLGFSDEDKQVWRRELVAIENRTYLWVHLVFDVIQEQVDFFTKDDLRAKIHELPKTVEAAYDKILSKSRHVDRAKKLLHIVVAAERALSLQEMAVALAITENHRSYSDFEDNILSLDLLHRKIREACGLFVIIKDSRIYLLHQTAKEFLIRPLIFESQIDTIPTLRWQYSLCPVESNRILSEICIWYMLLDDFELLDSDSPQSSTGTYLANADSQHIFLDYSSKNWFTHFRRAKAKSSDKTIGLALRLCSTERQICSIWFRAYWETTGSEFPQDFNTLMIASYFGLPQVVDSLLGTRNVDLPSSDTTYKRSALSWASGNGHDAIVESLLHRVPKYEAVLWNLLSRPPIIINGKDRFGRTPLWHAAANGHTRIVEMLLKNGAEVDCEDIYGQTPLSWALHNDHKATVQHLLQKGAKLESRSDFLDYRDNKGRTPLWVAIMNGDTATVQMLLDKGSDVNIKDQNGWTPLWWAILGADEAIVQMLLDKGADIEAKNNNGRTLLFEAFRSGYEATFQMALEKGADINTKDKRGRTLLCWIVLNADKSIDQKLLDKGVDIDAKHSNSRKSVISSGNEDPFQVFWDEVADMNVQDDGRTFLYEVFRADDEALIQKLIDNGADIDMKDQNGKTALWEAVNKENESALNKLLDNGADVHVSDNNGTTLIWEAIRGGNEVIIQKLLDKGADTNAKNAEGKFPLFYAISNGNEAVVQKLLDNDANIIAKLTESIRMLLESRTRC